MKRFQRIFTLMLALVLLLCLALSACQVQSPPQVLPDGTTAGDASDRGTDPTEITFEDTVSDRGTDPTESTSEDEVSDRGTDPTESTSEDSVTDETASFAQSEEFTEQPPDFPIIDIPLLTIASLDSYEEFLRTADLPDSFVPYSDFAALGSFNAFVCISNPKSGDYSECLYSLIDDSGFRFNVYVYTEGATPDLTQTSIITSVNEADLRTLSSESHGTYTKNGLRYNYSAGKLYSISWTVDDVTIEISEYSALYDYPYVSSTLVGKLLNTQTAESAVASISENLVK